MECAQIEITGGGGTSPSPVSFPGAYASMLVFPTILMLCTSWISHHSYVYSHHRRCPM
ncbi:hypothetical protein BDZ89DRAFT_1057330 [Hymenopellis radicata]|nr:hypothetical protein BDZ89DRAFT_1069594 [Hymenopellis radicata]KAF9050890.1 hypothetical protein BDZ89DRAFT_1057330 [Hymenopellis radicata]